MVRSWLLVCSTSEASWLKKSQRLTVSSASPTRSMRRPQLGCVERSLCKGPDSLLNKQGKEESKSTITSAHHSHRFLRKTIHALLAACCSPITSHSSLSQPFQYGRAIFYKKTPTVDELTTDRKNQETNYRSVLTEEQHVQRKMTRQGHLTQLLSVPDGLQGRAACENAHRDTT